jgi:hypothetical protein
MMVVLFILILDSIFLEMKMDQVNFFASTQMAKLELVILHLILGALVMD